jgi:signal peptide peptidase SppA
VPDGQTVNACDHLVAFAIEHPWALLPSMRSVVAGILARRIAGQASAPEDIAAAVVQRRNGPPATEQTVAVIPIYGVIAPRMNLISEMSGGTTFDKLTAQVHEALAVPNLKAIVFDIDSPGGNVAGATEFAREVLKARSKVPVIAQAQHLMASAAYWVGSCATEVVASPSSLVGSVGVYTIYDDISAHLEDLGVKRSVIAAGKYKGEGVDGGPLSDAAVAHRQALVDSCYARFLADVALGRGISVDAVRSDFGQGRVLNVADALDAGMVTRIATLGETLARFISPATAGAALARDHPAIATAQERPSVATAQERAAVIAEHHNVFRRQIHAEVHP